MKKTAVYLIIIWMCAVVVSSCEDDSVHFGDVEYYPAFLWNAADTMPLTKTFALKFSDEAKDDPKAFAEFSFVENDGATILPTDIMEVYIDGLKQNENKFRVKSDETAKEITISFTPKAKAGKHQGYLKLTDYNLDRVGNIILSENDNRQILQWTINFKKRWNPLMTFVVWLCIAIAAVLVLWFAVLRPVLYPHFGKFRKTVQISQNGQTVQLFVVNFKGAKKVVFASSKVKQPFLNRLFTGEIRTVVNPYFTQPLTFVPRGRNAIAHGAGYSIQNPILQNGKTEIHNTQNHFDISL